MCTGGLGDGIRVLTTYGPSFLSRIPAVSTGTMGSLLQTGKLMNILGVKCFYLTFRYLICHIVCTHGSICHQPAARMIFSTVFWPVYLHPIAVWNFISNSMVPSPPIPPLLTWQTRPESNPRAVLRGWFGGQRGLKSHTGKKCLNLCRKQRCRQKAPSSAVIEVNFHDLWGSINSLW